MKTVEEKINEITNNLSGNVLGICLSDSMLKTISKNDKIFSCDMLEKIVKHGNGNGKKQKPFNMKKLRKKFKKKTINYVIGNIEQLEKYFKFFINDTVYINSNTVYLYTNIKDYDYDKIERRYKRYNINVNKEECSDGIILKMEVLNIKNKKIRESFFYMIDIIIDLIDIIGDIL